MSDGPAPLRLGKCSTCHARYVPIDGPCPKCGSLATEAYVSAGVGTVLASTLLEVPPPGWTAPHPLALVEVEDGVRLLVVPDLPLPPAGTLVQVRGEEGIYRAHALGNSEAERGEGDVPAVGASRPPFEPPR